MFLQRKTVYNLLKLNLTQIEANELQVGNLKKWQIENYREKTTEELFQQLKGLGIVLESPHFETIGKNFEAPEEMAEAFAEEREPLEKDQIFLILFELWRRYFPEKRTISIFCDELDYQMIAYDLKKPSEISDALVYLQQLLEEHTDRGVEPQHALQLIQTYCANDIESFLFDFILNEIETNNRSYAAELLDGFKSFIKGKAWFDYLSARTLILEDPVEGYELLESLIEEVDESTHRDLVAEMLFFLAHGGNHSLFYYLASRTISFLKNEGDFQEFLEACYAHYDYLELKQPSLAIALLFHSRRTIPASQPLMQSDPGVIEMRSILEQKLHFAEE